MAIKKQQKRSIEESAPGQNGPANKKLQKPLKKMKTESVQKPVQKPTQKPAQKPMQKPVQKPVQSNGVQGKKPTKVEKQKNVVNQPKNVKITAPPETVNAKNAAKRLKNAEKMKRKNANRAEGRKEKGQYKPEQVLLSPEAMEIRIKEIESRPELTKTAKRRLVVLKKKLAIVRGTYVPKPKPEKSPLTKAQKRHLRKINSAKKRLAEGGASVSQVANKTQVVGKKNKKGAVLVKTETVKQETSAKVVGKKPQQLKPKEAMKFVVKKEEPEDSEDEDDDEEEDDSDDEAEESNASLLNTTEEQDDDDDDEEEDDDEDDDDEDDDDEEEDDEEDEEEEEVKVPVKKVKQEQEKKQPVKKEIKKEAVPNGEGGKKKRFVLFVGNLPFTSTAEDIKQHFLTKVGSVLSVRVPTAQGTNQPRGFAYVEVNNQIDYEKGLSLQGSNLNGRRLKVEYTESGSKSAGNRQDVISKNKKLHAMRKQGMLAGSKKDGHKRNDRRQKQRQQGPA